MRSEEADVPTTPPADNLGGSDGAFAVFALMAKQAQEAERVATAFQQQRQALLREHADDPVIQAGVWRMKQSEGRAKELAKELKKGAGRRKQRRHESGERFDAGSWKAACAQSTQPKPWRGSSWEKRTASSASS